MGFSSGAKLPVAVIMLLLSAGCAQSPVAPDASGRTGKLSAAVADQPRTPSEEQDFPNVVLSQAVLYDILLGEIAGRSGHFELAIQSLTRAALATSDPRLAERASLGALYAKRYADAEKAAQLWVRLRPEHRGARQALATALMALGRIKTAEAHYAKLLELAEREGELDKIYLQITAALVRQKHKQAATMMMARLVAKYPRNAFGQYGLAYLAFSAKDLARATAAVDRALLLLPKSEDIALLKGRILVQAAGATRAEQFYEEFLGRNAGAYRVRTQYARMLVDGRKWAKAAGHFEIVLKVRPDDHAVIYTLGLLALQRNLLDEAERYFVRAIELSPDDAQSRLFMGQLAERRGQLKDARRWYRSLEGGKLDFDARIRRAVLVAKEEGVDAGRKILRDARPKDDKQGVQLALAQEQMLREARKYGEAFAVLSQALKRYPKHTDLLYARALLAEKLDDVAQAERDLRQVLRLDPKNAHALNALGYTLADRTRRHKEALGLIERALNLRPNDPYILDSMGWVQYRMGQYKRAEHYLRRALKIRWDAEISAHLGEVLWVAGDREAARQIWREAIKRAPESEALRETVKKFKP